MRTRKYLIGAGATSLVVLVAFAVWLIATTWETRDEIPQSAFLPNEEGDPFLMPHATDATDTLCDVGLPCTWAVTTDTLTVMMFHERDDAKNAASTLPDARRSNWIVVQFAPGELTSQEKAEFMNGVNGLHTSGD